MNEWSVYYFIPWSNSQKYAEADKDMEYTVAGTYGIFALKDWVDNDCKDLFTSQVL